MIIVSANNGTGQSELRLSPTEKIFLRDTLSAICSYVAVGKQILPSEFQTIFVGRIRVYDWKALLGDHLLLCVFFAVLEKTWPVNKETFYIEESGVLCPISKILAEVRILASLS